MSRTRRNWKIPRGRARATYVAPADGRSSFSDMAVQLNLMPFELSPRVARISIRSLTSVAEKLRPVASPQSPPAALGVAFAGRDFLVTVGGVTTSMGDSWPLLLVESIFSVDVR